MGLRGSTLHGCVTRLIQTLCEVCFTESNHERDYKQNSAYTDVLPGLSKHYVKYVLLKAITKEIINKTVPDTMTSYFVKNILFWMVETTQRRVFWMAETTQRRAFGEQTE